jgi:hypothetical protein
LAGCRQRRAPATIIEICHYSALTLLSGCKRKRLGVSYPAALVMNMTITTANQIGDLLNLVHDHWFNVEGIVLDKEQKTVTIHLEEKKVNLAKGSKDGITLVIKNAEALTVNDSEKVRDYDLNEIKYDAPNGRLIITGGIPVTIEVKVSSLDIEVATAA